MRIFPDAQPTSEKRPEIVILSPQFAEELVCCNGVDFDLSKTKVIASSH
jgi:hypothetical protein